MTDNTAKQKSTLLESVFVETSMYDDCYKRSSLWHYSLFFVLLCRVGIPPTMLGYMGRSFMAAIQPTLSESEAWDQGRIHLIILIFETFTLTS